MRRSVRDQLSLVPAPFGHEHVRELQATRAILDAHPEFARWVQADLLAGGIAADRGRCGLSGEQVCARSWSSRRTGSATRSWHFHLADSQTYRGSASSVRRQATEEVDLATQHQAGTCRDARADQPC